MRHHRHEVDAVRVRARVAQVNPDPFPTRIGGIKGGRGDRVGAVIGIHQDRVSSPREALPHPRLVPADAAEVIGVVDDHLPLVRRVGSARSPCGRDPVGCACKQDIIVAVREQGRHSHRMLLWLGGLIRFEVRDHVVLPGFRPSITSSTLVTYLVEDVVEVVHCVDDLPDVRFLKRDDRGVEQAVSFEASVVEIRIAVNPVDVIVPVEGVPMPRVAVAHVLVLDRPAIEQHDRDIDAALARLHDVLTHPVKIGRIELAQVELWFAVERGIGAGAQVGHGVVPDVIGALGTPARRFPAPQLHEVVVV